MGTVDPLKYLERLAEMREAPAYAQLGSRDFLRNLSSDEQEELHGKAFDQGRESASNTLSSSDDPIFIQDECCLNDFDSSWMKGWNSIWASAENQQRWNRKTEAQRPE